MTAQGKVKTSYDFEPEIKHKLSRLKIDLRLRGITGISETAILEALIKGAKLAELASYFEKRRR